MFGGIPCPCGQCMPCRVNRKRLWTHRILLESYYHEKNSFVTLTYNEENLPEGGTLVPRDLQLFLKRARKQFAPHRLRFYAVGEYGDRTWRPHYHLALFGAGPEDSEIIDSSWKKGYTMCGDLNKNTAMYVCGYITKKLTKKEDERLQGRHPEFARMSNRPGIGAEAAKDIADALFSEYGKDMMQEGDAPISLKHGKRNLPLGRYLRDKIRDEIGVDEETKEIQKKKFLEEMLLMREVDLENEKFTQLAQASIKHYILEKNKQKRRNLEKRQNLFKQRKTI